MTLLMDTVWTANVVSSTVLAILLSIVGFWLRKYISDNDKRVGLVEKEQKEIKTNYTARFDGVNNNINEVKGLLQRNKEDIISRMDEKISHLGQKTEERINEVEKEKIDFRIKNAEIMGEVKQQLLNLNRNIENNNRRQ